MDTLLARTPYPWNPFRQACRKGLHVVRPFTHHDADDPQGWNFQAGWPPSYWAFGRLRALLALTEAQALRPNSVLELAAGDGALSASLASASCTVTANDLRTDVLATSLRRFTSGPAVRLLGGNLFELEPSTTGTFDLVVACEVLEHVADAAGFLTRIRQLLRPDGHALVTTPNGAFFRNRLPTWSQVTDFKALESRQFRPDADGHLFLITPAELASLAAAAGLRVLRMHAWGSPFITGNAGLRIFRGPWALHPACLLEGGVQRLPSRTRSRLCTALSAVLAPVA